MSSLEFLRVQQKVILDLMGKEWFSRPKNRISHHPAYQKFLVCDKFISQEGRIRWPEDRDSIKHLCAVLLVLLDSFDLVRSSGTKTDMFEFRSNVLSDFSGFGDNKSSSRIKSIINDPNIFSSLLTELSFAAWCFSKEYTVTPFEYDGYPDFKIEINGEHTPIFVECKKLMEGYGKSRISKIISKANKQIKATNKRGCGVVIIDATRIIENPNVFSDEIPEKIIELEGLIANSISSQNSLVSAVMIVWNDYVAMGEPSKSARMQFTFRRRQILIHHKSPIVELSESHPIEEYGATIYFWREFYSQDT